MKALHVYHALALFLSFAFSAAPDRFERPKMLDVSGPCQFGEIHQDGRQVRITGNDSWTATGDLRDDGRVILLWLHVGDGRTATGIYRLDAGGRNLVGKWGWNEGVEIGEDGELAGDVNDETLRRELR